MRSVVEARAPGAAPPHLLAREMLGRVPIKALDRVRAIGKAANVAGNKRSFFIALLTLATAGCSAESRTIGPDLPQTPPHGAADPRIARYERNVYQVSQGGRHFTWYGCAACHGADATGWRNLNDQQWANGSGFDQLYRFIAAGHQGALARYGERIRPSSSGRSPLMFARFRS